MKEMRRLEKALRKINKEIYKEHRIASRCKGDERLMHWQRADLLEEQREDICSKLAAA